MACRRPFNQNNFIRFERVYGGLTLAELQAQGIAALCNPADIAPPFNLQGIDGVINPILTWQYEASVFIDGFILYRNTTGINLEDSPYDVIDDPLDRTYTDTSTVVGTTYYYMIKATNGDVLSAPSNIISLTPLRIGIQFDGTNDFLDRTTDSINLGNDSNGDFSIYLDLKYTGSPSGTANRGIMQLRPTGGNFGVSMFAANSNNENTIQMSQGADSTFGTEIGWPGSRRQDALRHTYLFKKITHNGLNWQFKVDDALYTNPTIRNGRNLLKDYPTLDLVVNGVRIGRDWVGIFWQGVIGTYILTKPCLTDAQYDFLRNGGVANSAAAKTLGIGISGVDTIGVGGITTLVIRWVKMNEVYLSGGNYFVREEVTNNNFYAQLTNFATPSNPFVNL